MATDMQLCFLSRLHTANNHTIKGKGTAEPNMILKVYDT